MKNHASFLCSESVDRSLFAAYVELRRREFHAHYEGLAKDFGMPDEYDDTSRIVYMTANGELAGAARLTISSPAAPHILPLEECGFRLRECEPLRHLELELRPYSEISRMTIDPRFSRDREASLALAVGLCRAAAREGVETIFSICPPAATRLNQSNARSLGVNFQRFSSIATAYGRDMWLCVFTGIMQALPSPSPLLHVSPASAGAWAGISER